MDKKIIRVNIALLVWKNEELPIYKIHSAGGQLCVSGDRQLRHLHEEYLTADPPGSKAVGYIYDGSTPKRYIFMWKFRMFCKAYFITHKLRFKDTPVRVQTPKEAIQTDSMPHSSRTGLCEFCGSIFPIISNRKSRRFCSAKCRVNAWRIKSSPDRQ